MVTSLADFRCINLSIIIHRYTVYKTICFADKKNTKGLIDKLFHMSLFAVFVKFLLTFQTMDSVIVLYLVSYIIRFLKIIKLTKVYDLPTQYPKE